MRILKAKTQEYGISFLKRFLAALGMTVCGMHGIVDGTDDVCAGGKVKPQIAQIPKIFMKK